MVMSKADIKKEELNKKEEKEAADDVDKYIDPDDVKRRGRAVFKYLSEQSKIQPNDVAPSTFNYRIDDNSIGLNIFSNTDIGYINNTVDGQHASKRRPCLTELKRHSDLVLDSNNAIVVINGGLFTYVPKSSSKKLLPYRDQLAYFHGLFEDLAKAGKIVAMVRGEEEHRILQNHGIDVMGILKTSLGLPDIVCNDAYITMLLKDDMVKDPVVGIKTIDWKNTATTTSYISRKMEERGTRRGGAGADIFLARTGENFFTTSIAGIEHDGKVEKKPIYLISAGPYTSFLGAKTAGAEYNSIKDQELMPNCCWYKVTVEPKADGMPDRPYIVRVNPVEYSAHQVTSFSADKTTASIMQLVDSRGDEFIKYLLTKYPEVVGGVRQSGIKEIRDTLIGNRKIAERHALIEEFLRESGDGSTGNGAKVDECVM